MPRTAITISSALTYFQGVTGGVTLVAGDAANDHQIDISAGTTHLALIAVNTGAGTISFTVELPASAQTFNTAVSKSITIPAAVAGKPGVQFVMLDDFGALSQTGSLVHIDSTSLATTWFAVVRWSSPVTP